MELDQETLLKHLTDVTSRMSALDAQTSTGNTFSSNEQTSSMETTSSGGQPTNADISRMANQLTQNPEMMTGLIDKIPDVISPEMMAQAQKLVGSGQAEKLIGQMKDRGIDPQAMRSQLVQRQSKAKGMVKHDETTQTVIIVNMTKQTKVREFQKVKMLESAAVNLKIKPEDVKDISCRIMAQGILEGKKVKIFYNPNDKAINKRVKKIVGFPIGGDVIFYIENENLTEQDFENVEKYITTKE